MICAFSADGTFMRFGHKKEGYSIGCALTALGDTLFALTHAASGNVTLQIMLTATATAYAAGASRFPLEIISKRIQKSRPSLAYRLQSASDKLPPIVGTLSFLFLVPAIVASALGGNYVAFATTLLWGITDILVGRVHEYIIQPVARLLK